MLQESKYLIKMSKNLATESLLKLHTFCDNVGINVNDVKVSNKKDDFVRVECKLCQKSTKYHTFEKHTMMAHGITRKVYEQKYGEKNRHIKDKVLHKCVICGDFMLLDYEEIRNHLRKKNHNKSLSDYINEVIISTNIVSVDSNQSVKTANGKDLKKDSSSAETLPIETFDCGECGKLFHDRGYLKFHLKCHETGAQRKSNERIRIRTPNSKDLKIVSNDKEPQSVGRIPCSKSCGKHFASKSAVNKHILLQHTSKEKWPFECPLCKIKFVARCDKKRHLIMTKTNHKGLTIPSENSLEFRELLYSEMRAVKVKSEPEPIDESHIIVEQKSSDLQESLRLESVATNCNENEEPASESEHTVADSEEMNSKVLIEVSEQTITPLEELVLRFDNNEIIPTDELILIIDQIVKT